MRPLNGEIRQYLAQMLSDFPSIRHELLDHEVDEAEQRSTCRFTLRLEDAEGRGRETSGRAEFHLGNGKLSTVTVESDGGAA